MSELNDKPVAKIVGPLARDQELRFEEQVFEFLSESISPLEGESYEDFSARLEEFWNHNHGMDGRFTDGPGRGGMFWGRGSDKNGGEGGGPLHRIGRRIFAGPATPLMKRGGGGFIDEAERAGNRIDAKIAKGVAKGSQVSEPQQPSYHERDLPDIIKHGEDTPAKREYRKAFISAIESGKSVEQASAAGKIAHEKIAPMPTSAWKEPTSHNPLKAFMQGLKGEGDVKGAPLPIPKPKSVPTKPVSGPAIGSPEWKSLHVPSSAEYKKKHGLSLSGAEEFANAGNPQALFDWYDAGAKGVIQWNTPGDLTRCFNIASKYLADSDAWGFCNNRHFEATGEYNSPKD